MRYYDISLNLSPDTVRWVVAPPLVNLERRRMSRGDDVNATQVPVHRAFLDHGVVLLEGIDLSEISPGRYELICFPLRLRGLDGAPCRAVLRDLQAHPC